MAGWRTNAGESKAVLRDRLLREGRLEQYTKRREELKDEGFDAVAASIRAADDFPPLEGGVPQMVPEGGTVPPADVASGSTSAAGLGLVSLEVFEGRECSEHEAIRWVAEHLEVDVKPEAAPAALAWALLQWARSSSGTKQAFWASMWVKILPSKAQLEVEAKFKDDGGALGVVEDLISARARIADEKAAESEAG